MPEPLYLIVRNARVFLACDTLLTLSLKDGTVKRGSASKFRIGKKEKVSAAEIQASEGHASRSSRCDCSSSKLPLNCHGSRDITPFCDTCACFRVGSGLLRLETLSVSLHVVKEKSNEPCSGPERMLGG